MSKLQRVVGGQSIQFAPLARIFGALSMDLPSGAITFANGEKAFWRLQRNVSEMKQQEMSTIELSSQLADALIALVGTPAFRNHYGLTEQPKMPSTQTLVDVFRNLLVTNSARAEYSSIAHGPKKELVENIVIPFGNQVILRATRGNRKGRPAPATPAKSKGIKGKLWLSEADGEDKAFTFLLHSPVVNLTEYMTAERLKVEILNKIKNNLGVMSNKASLVFDDGQFNQEELLSKSLNSLVEQHPAAKNGAGKKQKAAKLVSAPEVIVTQALHSEAFAELTQNEKDAYLELIAGLIKSDKAEDKSTLRAFLVSGILTDAWKIFNDKRNAAQAMSLPFFLANAVGINSSQFAELLGSDEPLYLPRVKAVAGEKYTVVDGDTLSAISLEAYGNADLYPAIVEANQPIISNPDLIYPGWVLVLPVIDGTVSKAAEAAPVLVNSALCEEVEITIDEPGLEHHLAKIAVSDAANRLYYIDSASKLCSNNDPAHDEFFKKFVLSNILESEWLEYNKTNTPISHSFWLSKLLKMDEARFYRLLGIPAAQAEAMKVAQEEKDGKLDLSGYDPEAVMKELEAQNSQATRVYKIEPPVSENTDLRIDEQLDALTETEQPLAYSPAGCLDDVSGLIPSISADDDVGPDTIVLSTTVSSFLETHDPAKFANGTRAILTAPDGVVTNLEKIQDAWHRVETIGGEQVPTADNKA